MGDRFAQTNRVPVDDDGGEQVEASDAVVLTLRGPAVPDLALAAGSPGVLHRMTGLQRPIWVCGCMPGSSVQSIRNGVRRTRPEPQRGRNQFAASGRRGYVKLSAQFQNETPILGPIKSNAIFNASSGVILEGFRAHSSQIPSIAE